MKKHIIVMYSRVNNWRFDIAIWRWFSALCSSWTDINCQLSIINCQLLICLIPAIFVSCDDFLTEEMKGDYSTATFYTSQQSAIMAVNGVYNSISFTSANNRIWVFGDVASDDAVKGGNPGDGADIVPIDELDVAADNGIVNNYWQYLYESVSQANNAITYIPSVSMDATLKDRLVAEAKFIRALAYFNLVNVWGKVPLKLKPQTTADAVNVPLSEVADIYAQIEKDLNDAKAVLPPSYTGTDAGRATSGAAYGLLAKVQLYQKKYPDCLSSIQSLEALNQYDLVSNYENLFKAGSEDSVEVIFAVRHMSGQNPGLGNGMNQWFAPLEESGYYFNAPTQSYVDAFNELTADGQVDPRLDASIGRDGQPWLNGNTFSASWSPTGYLVKKHDQPLSEVPAGRKGDGYLPYIYLRYADILLMKAEALNEAGGTNAVTTAAVELNKVRDRAGLVPTIASTQTTMQTAIQTERRRELGFEFHRFFDLMRWGKDVAEAALGPDFKWTEPRYYFPLPQAELDANQAIK